MNNSTNRNPTELIPTANQQQPNEATNKGSKKNLGVISIDQTDPIQQAIKIAVSKVSLLNGLAAIETGKSTKHQHWQDGEIPSFRKFDKAKDNMIDNGERKAIGTLPCLTIFILLTVMGFFLAGTVVTQAHTAPGYTYHGIVEEFRLFDGPHSWHPVVISSSSSLDGTVGTFQQQQQQYNKRLSLGAIHPSYQLGIDRWGHWDRLAHSNNSDSSTASAPPAAGGASAYHQLCLNGETLSKFSFFPGSLRRLWPITKTVDCCPFFKFIGGKTVRRPVFSVKKGSFARFLTKKGGNPPLMVELSGAGYVQETKAPQPWNANTQSDSKHPICPFFLTLRKRPFLFNTAKGEDHAANPKHKNPVTSENKGKAADPSQTKSPRGLRFQVPAEWTHRSEFMDRVRDKDRIGGIWVGAFDGGILGRMGGGRVNELDKMECGMSEIQRVDTREYDHMGWGMGESTDRSRPVPISKGIRGHKGLVRADERGRGMGGNQRVA